jgi:hypothetical protein
MLGATALCDDLRRRTNVLPEAGCVSWEREPGADDEPGPPPTYRGLDGEMLPRPLASQMLANGGFVIHARGTGRPRMPPPEVLKPVGPRNFTPGGAAVEMVV